MKSTPDGHLQKARKASRPSRLLWLWPAAVGVGIGITLLAPFAHGPSDPIGRSIGAGLGGLLGLAIPVISRYRSRSTSAGAGSKLDNHGTGVR
jgi:hypothetical protein